MVLHAFAMGKVWHAHVVLEVGLLEEYDIHIVLSISDLTTMFKKFIVLSIIFNK